MERVLLELINCLEEKSMELNKNIFKMNSMGKYPMHTENSEADGRLQKVLTNYSHDNEQMRPKL